MYVLNLDAKVLMQTFAVQGEEESKCYARMSKLEAMSLANVSTCSNAQQVSAQLLY